MEDNKTANETVDQEVNNMFIDCFRRLDPNDPDYSAKVESIAKVYAQAVADFKAHEETAIAKAKLDDDFTVNTEKNRIDSEATLEACRANRARERLDKFRTAGYWIIGLLTAGTNIWAFKRSTAKEADEALLTNTQRTTVTESLKKGFFKLFPPKHNE